MWLKLVRSDCYIFLFNNNLIRVCDERFNYHRPAVIAKHIALEMDININSIKQWD